MNGTELRELREKLKLSPTQAAASIEVSARTWQRWESGANPVPPAAERLFKILHGIEKPPRHWSAHGSQQPTRGDRKP